MKYYKIVNNNNILAVITEEHFRRYSSITKAVMVATIAAAQFCEAGDAFYHANWMKPIAGEIAARIGIVDVDSIENIGIDEYNALKEAIENNEEVIPVIPDEPEEDIPEEIPGEDIGEDTSTLEFVKQAKIAQMKKACHDAITNGVDVVLLDGITHHFTMEIEDQINLQSLVIKIQRGYEGNLPWHSDGELAVFYSPEDIMSIYEEFERVQTYHTTYFNSLKHYIESLDTIDAVAGIQYGVEIPEAYQSDVLKYLLNGGG